jgi:mannose-6-phosphate isomerase
VHTAGPIALAPHQLTRFYAGGAGLAALRGRSGGSSVRDDGPEDWVGSTTTAFGKKRQGLTVLPGGRVLRHALAEDPQAWLGPVHAARWGSDPGLLVKLLDAGERLPVHVHPDRAFARRHLDCPWGKTEAWVILATGGGPGTVHLGFRRDVGADELAELVQAQDTATLLGLLHTLTVEPGDAVLVPAGMPHAIGQGVTLLELQEPTDFSVLLEWDGFAIDGARDGHLGLGFDVALDCVRRAAVTADAVPQLRRAPAAEGSLLPPAADPFFRADRLPPGAHLTQGFAILLVERGSGALRTSAGATPMQQGETWLLPYAAGPAILEGEATLLRCRPADPADAPDTSDPPDPAATR